MADKKKHDEVSGQTMVAASGIIRVLADRIRHVAPSGTEPAKMHVELVAEMVSKIRGECDMIEQWCKQYNVKVNPPAEPMEAKPVHHRSGKHSANEPPTTI